MNKYKKINKDIVRDYRKNNNIESEVFEGITNPNKASSLKSLCELEGVSYTDEYIRIYSDKNTPKATKLLIEYIFGKNPLKMAIHDKRLKDLCMNIAAENGYNCKTDVRNFTEGNKKTKSTDSVIEFNENKIFVVGKFRNESGGGQDNECGEIDYTLDKFHSINNDQSHFIVFVYDGSYYEKIVKNLKNRHQNNNVHFISQYDDDGKQKDKEISNLICNILDGVYKNAA